MSKFLIACGGTGGHLAPGIALAQSLHARGHTTTLFISQKRVDARLCEHYPELATERVPSAPFGWRPDVHLRFHWRQTQGLLFSLKFLRQHRPDAIIGFGGFTNAGVVMAGKLLDVPVALHEANRIPGLAIRVLSRISKRLYLPPGVRLPGRLGLVVRHTGLPVRREVNRIPRDEARAQLGVDPAQRLLVLFGGSQGSTPLNDWLHENLGRLASAGVQVWCVTGLDKGEGGVRKLHAKNGAIVRAWFEPFTDRVGTLLSAADLVLSRAGAGTLAELVHCETPAILVPYPHAADNHQQANAEYFERHGGGLMIAQTDLGRLQAVVLETLGNERLLRKYRDGLQHMDRASSLELMLGDLETLARAPRSPGAKSLIVAAA